MGILKPTVFVKIGELLFVVIAFGILRGAPSSFLTVVDILAGDDAEYFGSGVLVTCLFVTPLLLACHLMGKSHIQKETIFEFVFNFAMFICLLSAGSVACNSWRKSLLHEQKKKGLAMGSMCIIASFTYLGDAALSFMEYKKTD